MMLDASNLKMWTPSDHVVKFNEEISEKCVNPFNDCSLNFIDSISINQEAFGGLFDNENRSYIFNLLTAAFFS